MPRRGLECIAVSVLTDWKDSPSEDSLNSYDDHHHHSYMITIVTILGSSSLTIILDSYDARL